MSNHFSYRLVTMAGISLLLLAACTSAAGTPTPTVPPPPATPTPVPATPTAEPVEVSPPEATVNIGGQSQVSGEGSFCWTAGTGEPGLCADKVGIPTVQEPLQATSPMMAAFAFGLPDPPNSLSLNMYPVTPQDELAETALGLRWWRPVSSDPVQIPLGVSEAEINLEPGLYVWSVFAIWEGRGDVNYGFLVEVPAGQGLDFTVLETDVKAVVTLLDEVTLYSGPGETYPPVATVFGGLRWPVNGVSEMGDWWRLSCTDDTGGAIAECWVSADPFVTAPADLPADDSTAVPAAPRFIRIVAEAGLNLRAGPDLTTEVLDILPAGQLLTVTGASQDGAWWRVLCPDDSVGDCWVTAEAEFSEPITNTQEDLAGLLYRPVDPQFQLWSVGADQQATLLLENNAGVTISPDGRFAVRCCFPRGEGDLTLTDLETNQSSKLTDTPDRFNFNPQFWPANPETIVFLSQTKAESGGPTGPGLGFPAVVDTDGTNFTLLDDTRILVTNPSPSPDGQTIAYSGGDARAIENGTLSPWTVRLGEEPQPFDITPFELGDIPDLAFGAPAWSPNGSKLAWVVGGELVADAGFQVGIALLDLNASTGQILNTYQPQGQPEQAGSFAVPVWSPDSQWLAWSGFPVGSPPGFWVLKADGSESQYFPQGDSPVWSPDGRLLAFNNQALIQVMAAREWVPKLSGLPADSVVTGWVRSP